MCGGSPSGSRRPRAAVSTMRPRSSMHGCRTAPACTASSRRSRSGGTLISLRIPQRSAFTLDDLVERGTIDDAGADVLRAMIAARLAFLVSGGTGSGKTTVLSSLLGLMPPHQRLVIVEDSTELDPDHPHVVRMQARTANVEGAGVVSLRDLVRQALRMRPDRLVLGEVRGAEVVDLLAAMNTGHEGGAGTVHANSAADVPARLEALGLTAGLDRLAVHALIGAGIDAVLHLGRDDLGRARPAGDPCARARNRGTGQDGARPDPSGRAAGARGGPLSARGAARSWVAAVVLRGRSRGAGRSRGLAGGSAVVRCPSRRPTRARRGPPAPVPSTGSDAGRSTSWVASASALPRGDAGHASACASSRRWAPSRPSWRRGSRRAPHWSGQRASRRSGR